MRAANKSFKATLQIPPYHKQPVVMQDFTKRTHKESVFSCNDTVGQTQHTLPLLHVANLNSCFHLQETETIWKIWSNSTQYTVHWMLRYTKKTNTWQHLKETLSRTGRKSILAKGQIIKPFLTITKNIMFFQNKMHCETLQQPEVQIFSHLKLSPVFQAQQQPFSCIVPPTTRKCAAMGKLGRVFFFPNTFG